MEDQDNINEHLKGKLEEFKLNPRITSFEEIQKKMAKKKRKGFFFVLVPGLFLLSGIAGYLFFTRETTSSLALNERTIEYKETLKMETLSTPEKIESSEKTKRPETAQVPGSDLNPEKNAAQTLEKKIPEEKQKNNLTNQTKESLATTIKTPQKRIFKASLSSAVVSTSVKKKKKVAEEESKKVVEDGNVERQGNLTPDAKDARTIHSEQSKVYSDAPDNLDLVYLPLKYERAIQNMQIDSLKEIPMVKHINDSIKKEKKLSFCMGAYINPQMGAYILKQRKVMTSEQVVSDAYMKAVKNQNVLLFNYAFGLKAGILIKNEWEILAGFGFQKYTQKSQAVLLPISQYTIGNTSSPSMPQVYNTNSAADLNSVYKSVFRYYDFSAEVARHCTINRFFKIKYGLGLHAQNLSTKSKIYSGLINTNAARYDAYNLYNEQQVRKWIGTIHLKAGLIEEIGKRIQFQVCPNIFYSPTSMTRKDNYINQKNYGFGLECLLLFRLR